MPQSKSSNSEPPAAGSRALSGHSEFVAAALEMLASARHEVCLLSFDLDARLYNREDITEALKDFILLSPRSRLRILLRDDAPAARGHRVVDLARTLSSYSEFRVLGEQERNVQSDWLIVDGRHLLERRSPDSLESTRHTNPSLARAHHSQFNNWWQTAAPASALRALHFQ